MNVSIHFDDFSFSVRCSDLTPQPYDSEPPPITTRPEANFFVE